MSNISVVTSANIITTARTAAPAAASSTATPYDSGNITTWTLPNYPTQKLVNGTQSFSTTPGQVFVDFCSSQIVTPGLDTSVPNPNPALYSLEAGTPTIE